MIRTATVIGQFSMAGVGVASSLTYILQSCCQIKRHGFWHWLEVGFEKLEDEVEGDRD